MKKAIVLIIIGIVVVGGAAFYGGVVYEKASRDWMRGDSTQFAGMLPAGTGAVRRTGSGGGFVGGEIIARDDQSITVRGRDGGSRIVFVSAAAEVVKTVQGSPADLAVGEQVTVAGSANPDGSITAQSVQVRSAVEPVRR